MKHINSIRLTNNEALLFYLLKKVYQLEKDMVHKQDLATLKQDINELSTSLDELQLETIHSDEWILHTFFEFRTKNPIEEVSPRFVEQN